VGQHEGAGAEGRPVAERHDEPVGEKLGVDDHAVTDLDVGVLGKLLATRGAEIGGRGAVLAQQPADPVGDGVRRPAGVEDEDALPCPAQDERGAQAGRTAADDYGVERRSRGGGEGARRTPLPAVQMSNAARHVSRH
jgi:hypothetical protein